MCETSDIIVMVADSKPKSLAAMCEALKKLGLKNIVCAKDTKQGLQLLTDIANSGEEVNMLFCNANLTGFGISDFINFVRSNHKRVITISYSKCVAPEAHIMSMFNTGSLDHIEQNQDFDASVSLVANRWLRAAKLQHDYGQRYGNR